MTQGKLGSDPGSVVFSAIEKAQKENFDMLLIDTAGRLQNKTDLMAELDKILRIIRKKDHTAPHNSILVLDATSGQNIISQTELFLKTAGITGVIMTKLDGTAKGGVLVSLANRFKLPIHFIGLGEGIEDLEVFEARGFANVLVGIDQNNS